jgi:hypothetical protein
METIDNIATTTDTATQLSDFDKAWAQGITSEECLQEMYRFIDLLPWDEKLTTNAAVLKR